MDFSYNYSPLLRTKDAELKAYSNLDSSIKEGILPIFEITRSRRSKLNPDGNINKKIDQISEIIDSNPFILDLTVHEDWSNIQIDSILNDYEEGYLSWCDFLDRLNFESIIPMIHYNINATASNIEKQVSRLEDKYQNLAYRDNVFSLDLIERLTEVIGYCKKPENLIVILDAGYINILNLLTPFNAFQQRIEEINDTLMVNSIIIVGSNFPQNVKAPGYGGDSQGEFSISEIEIFNKLKKLQSKHTLRYGDYASITPNPYPGGGGGWVPRVDIPLNDKYFYHRFRRESGGYITAAQAVVNDSRYEIVKTIDTWGDQEIKIAADGNPNGISPAHWISVRTNLHITRQYLRTV